MEASLRDLGQMDVTLSFPVEGIGVTQKAIDGMSRMRPGPRPQDPCTSDPLGQLGWSSNSVMPSWADVFVLGAQSISLMMAVVFTIRVGQVIDENRVRVVEDGTGEDCWRSVHRRRFGGIKSKGHEGTVISRISPMFLSRLSAPFLLH
jgi:hypothetical protein